MINNLFWMKKYGTKTTQLILLCKLEKIINIPWGFTHKVKIIYAPPNPLFEIGQEETFRKEDLEPVILLENRNLEDGKIYLKYQKYFIEL